MCPGRSPLSVVSADRRERERRRRSGRRHVRRVRRSRHVHGCVHRVDDVAVRRVRQRRRVAVRGHDRGRDLRPVAVDPVAGDADVVGARRPVEIDARRVDGGRAEVGGRCRRRRVGGSRHVRGVRGGRGVAGRVLGDDVVAVARARQSARVAVGARRRGTDLHAVAVDPVARHADVVGARGPRQVDAVRRRCRRHQRGRSRRRLRVAGGVSRRDDQLRPEAGGAFLRLIVRPVRRRAATRKLNVPSPVTSDVTSTSYHVPAVVAPSVAIVAASARGRSSS